MRPQPAQQLPWRMHLSMGSQGAHPVKELEAVCTLTVQGPGLGLKPLGGYSHAFRLRLGQLQAGLRGERTGERASATSQALCSRSSSQPVLTRPLK